MVHSLCVQNFFFQMAFLPVDQSGQEGRRNPRREGKRASVTLQSSVLAELTVE